MQGNSIQMQNTGISSPSRFRCACPGYFNASQTEFDRSSQMLTTGGGRGGGGGGVGGGGGGGGQSTWSGPPRQALTGMP